MCVLMKGSIPHYSGYAIRGDHILHNLKNKESSTYFDFIAYIYTT
jgi:hypothetical protein